VHGLLSNTRAIIVVATLARTRDARRLATFDIDTRSSTCSRGTLAKRLRFPTSSFCASQTLTFGPKAQQFASPRPTAWESRHRFVGRAVGPAVCASRGNSIRRNSTNGRAVGPELSLYIRLPRPMAWAGQTGGPLALTTCIKNRRLATAATSDRTLIFRTMLSGLPATSRWRPPCSIDGGGPDCSGSGMEPPPWQTRVASTAPRPVCRPARNSDGQDGQGYGDR